MKILILSLLTATLAQAGINDHFHCTSPMFFNRLEVEVEQQKETNKITLRSFDANRAADALGIGSDKELIHALVLNLPKDWCRFSEKLLGVFSCNLPSRWPPLNAEITALGDNGKVLGTTTLSHLTINIDHTVRTSAGFDLWNDWVRHNLEFDSYMISEKDNAKRAKIGLPFEVENCGRH